VRQRVKLACKPGSVEHLAAPRQPFIWAGSCLSAQATYPGAARAALSPPYLVLLRMGFAVPFLLPETRWALTLQSRDRHAPCGAHTVSPSPDPTSFSLQERDFAALRSQSWASAIGSLFSVALSIASRRPAVSRHPALRSPDFPLRKRIAQRLPGQLRNGLSHRKAGSPDFSCGMTLIRCTAKSQPSQQHRSRQPREVVLCASALPDWQAKKEGRLPLG
jgi:hypothetical protein